MSHSYTNPSEKQDLAHLEAAVEEGEMIDPATGFTKRKPISDKECILKSLENSTMLTGLDKNQVEKIIKQFKEPRKFFENRLIDRKNITCTIDDMEVDCDTWDEEYPAL